IAVQRIVARVAYERVVAATAVDSIVSRPTVDGFRIVAARDFVTSSAADDDLYVVLDVVGFVGLAVVRRTVDVDVQSSQSILVVHAVRTRAAVEGVPAIGGKGGNEGVVARVTVQHVDVLIAVVCTGAAVERVVT